LIEKDDLERRSSDIGSTLSDLRVSVARIEGAQNSQAETMRRLENKLDLGVFREEYERRHKVLEDAVDAVSKDYQRRIGRQQIWRVVTAGSIGIIAAVVGAIALKVFGA